MGKDYVYVKYSDKLPSECSNVYIDGSMLYAIGNFRDRAR